MKKQNKPDVAAFASEGQEAAWWYENRKSHDEELATAVENGAAQVLTPDKLRERIAASTAKMPAQVIWVAFLEADASGLR